MDARGGTVSENRQAAMRGARPGGEPFSELCRKVVLLITEDWFALSHFRPLIALLQEIAHEVVVVTHSSGRLAEIEALGARVIDFDYRRSSSNPAREAASALPPPGNDVPVAAFVGRMIRPKGIDVLMQACDRLKQSGAPIQLELYGAADADNPEAITADVLTAWCAQHEARWLGHVADVQEVWRHADIFVLPARSREGMPRALLEAAACARPLV